MNNLPYDFYNSIERNHDTVIYSDTDSLFINIKNVNIEDINLAISKSSKISKLINDNITKYMNDYLLPKMGGDLNYNYTHFKTEIIAKSLLLSDAKKSYAYKLLAKEGVVLKTPKVKYVGLSVVRSDSAKLTQDMLKYIIDDIILSDTPMSSQDMLKKATEFIIYCKNKFNEYIKTYNFDDIGIPCKWGGKKYANDPAGVTGMKLWNMITNSTTFTPMSSGRRIFIKNINYEKLPDKSKVTNLTIPFNIEQERVKSIFENFNIQVDNDKLWDTLYSTVCRRMIELIKMS